MNATAPERNTPTAQLSGVIERVMSLNEESGFCVLRIKAPGHREEARVLTSEFFFPPKERFQKYVYLRSTIIWSHSAVPMFSRACDGTADINPYSPALPINSTVLPSGV
jgi:hypothetical protein